MAHNAGPVETYGPIGSHLLDEPEQLADDLRILGVVVRPDQDALEQLVHSATQWLEIDINAEPAPIVPHEQTEAYPALQRLGLTEATKPPHNTYDVAFVDGGTTIVFDLRLDYLEQLRAEGLRVPTVVLCAGQRTRLPRDGELEQEAAVHENAADPWVRQWLTTELAKTRGSDNVWERSFATEHEVAIMALLRRYGNHLHHETTILRADPQSLSPSVPLAVVQAEIFSVDDTTFTVLNGQAMLRELHGQPLPTGEARPTGASCFQEWLDCINPPDGTSILLVSNQPNTERTLYDLLIVARRSGRSLALEYAAGPIEEGSSYGRVLSALARIAIALSELRRQPAAVSVTAR